jgi:hypothetical protein
MYCETCNNSPSKSLPNNTGRPSCPPRYTIRALPTAFTALVPVRVHRRYPHHATSYQKSSYSPCTAPVMICIFIILSQEDDTHQNWWKEGRHHSARMTVLGLLVLQKARKASAVASLHCISAALLTTSLLFPGSSKLQLPTRQCRSCSPIESRQSAHIKPAGLDVCRSKSAGPLPKKV